MNLGEMRLNTIELGHKTATGTFFYDIKPVKTVVHSIEPHKFQVAEKYPDVRQGESVPAHSRPYTSEVPCVNLTHWALFVSHTQTGLTLVSQRDKSVWLLNREML